MSESAPNEGDGAFPGWEGFLQAVRERTLAAGDDPTRRVDTGAIYYPLIGAALGIAAVVVDRFAEPLAGRAFASAAVVALWTVLTRGRSLFGLAKTLAAALAASPQRRFALLAGPSGWGVVLVAALLAVAEVLLVARLDRFRGFGLLFAPMLGHCAMLVTATGSRAARDDGRVVKFAPALTFREFGIASTATFAAVFLSTDFLGLLMVLVTGISTLALRMLLHFRFGGVHSASLAAAGELVQFAVLALLTRL